MNLVILTGAGISAESGVATFRDKDGLWSKFSIEEVATPEAFAQDPAKVQGFYNMRRAALPTVAPNRAHTALVELEAAFAAAGAGFTLITQNVDDLHRRAGSKNLLQMHGALDLAQCNACRHEERWTVDIEVGAACPKCAVAGTWRPAVVWFGEMPRYLDQIEQAIATATHFAAIGTSGAVYPAAGLVSGATQVGAETTLINLDPADNATLFDRHLYGPASETVPAFAEEMIALLD